MPRKVQFPNRNCPKVPQVWAFGQPLRDKRALRENLDNLALRVSAVVHSVICTLANVGRGIRDAILSFSGAQVQSRDPEGDETWELLRPPEREP